METERRLIDADALIEEVRRQAKIDPVTYPIISATLNAVSALANDLTTVDAVEVVRCKDCKHCIGTNASRTERACTTGVNWRAVEPNHFCSYGERRTDNDSK